MLRSTFRPRLQQMNATVMTANLITRQWPAPNDIVLRLGRLRDARPHCTPLRLSPPPLQYTIQQQSHASKCSHCANKWASAVNILQQFQAIIALNSLSAKRVTSLGCLIIKKLQILRSGCVRG